MTAVGRRYIDGPFGQMHLRVAAPDTVPRRAPLLCFHMSPYSGAVYETFLAEMGRDRIAVAVDTPGFGLSDAPPAPPEIPDYARAMGAVMDALHLRGVSLMGYHTGSKIAVELALQRPDQVRRLVLVSAPIYTPEEAAARHVAFGREDPSEDGAHLMRWWQTARRWSMAGRPLMDIAKLFPERMRNPEVSWWGHRAAFNYNSGEALPKVAQPVLILNPEDDLWHLTPRARRLLKHSESRVHDLPGWSHGFLDMKTVETAALLRGFLDGPAG